MRILAFDSGAAVPVVGAVELSGNAAELVAWSALEEPRALGRELVGRIHQVLQEAGWALPQLDLIATGTGPGSWTSLRVGVSTARTLCQAHALPLAGVPSFDAVAAVAHAERLAARARGRKGKASEAPPVYLQVVSSCRPGEVYGKLFLSHPEYLGIAQTEWIASPQRHLDAAFAQMMATEIHAELVLCGELPAVEATRKLLEAQGDAHRVVEVAPANLVLELALAGAARLAEGEADDPMTLVPLYLAPSNAERNLANGTLKPR